MGFCFGGRAGTHTMHACICFGAHSLPPSYIHECMHVCIHHVMHLYPHACICAHAVLDLLRIDPEGLRGVVSFHGILDDHPIAAEIGPDRRHGVDDRLDGTLVVHEGILDVHRRRAVLDDADADG